MLANFGENDNFHLSKSEDFLAKIARDHDLSEEQEEAFVALFSSNQSQQEVADKLHISHNAFRTRMNGVYRKFSLNSKGPNKARKLHDFLLKKVDKKKELVSQSGSDICPYKGLRYFDDDEQDAKYFYGQKQFTDELIYKVSQSNFLAIFGPSGSGKSSLLRAKQLKEVK